MDVRLERKVTYYKRRNGVVDVWIHLGRLELLESLGIRIDRRVWCLRLDDDRVVLEPIVDASNPRDVRCPHAVIHIQRTVGTARMRMPIQFFRAIGMPPRVTMIFKDNMIELYPEK